MNPKIEDFLEEAFASIKPTSDAIGRVVVEPDYEANETAENSQQLRSELIDLLKGQSVDDGALRSKDGLEIKIPSRYPTLCKYVRRITLHAAGVEGDWIEVAPPGSWI